MKQLTFWLHQFDSSSLSYCRSYDEVARHVAELNRPNDWSVGLMVKTHSGSAWQADFDRHPLAIDDRSIERLQAACAKVGVQTGAWGEPRGDGDHGGALAGRSAAVLGYYCADVEPYSDFQVPNRDRGNSAAEIASFAVEFWWRYSVASGVAGPGVSFAPQPSGVDPFGWEGLLAWLAPVKYLQAQCYYTTAPQLNPDVAVPFLDARIAAVNLPLERFVHLPILESATWNAWRDDARFPEGLDVWAL